ncbi:branched-chain amino acid ABC transporter permease [Micromonospora sonneratiae]|uniref:Branched-chain amino acid ABC transporter permease n=1 Tax=Micromonospora sonneratiae TaxID=1184706 RepID=A0ABW3Y9E0_9ACTN
MRLLDLAVDGLTLGSVYAMVAIGFHLIFRTSGVVDFSQGEKLVLGGLIGLTMLQQGVSMYLILVLVPLIGFGLGGLYERVVIRPTQRNGETAVITASVGAMLFMAYGHVLVWGANGEPFPAITAGSVEVFGAAVSYQSFWIWGTLLLVTVLLYLGANHSRFGKGMIAAASDPVAATAVGINVAAARVVAFALAFGLAALGGVLVAPITLAGGTVGALLVLKGFTGAVLGGIDSLPGVIVGSLLLGVVENLLGGMLPSGYKEPLVLTLLLVALLVVPSGIFGRRGARLA